MLTFTHPWLQNIKEYDNLVTIDTTTRNEINKCLTLEFSETAALRHHARVRYIKNGIEAPNVSNSWNLHIINVYSRSGGARSTSCRQHTAHLYAYTSTLADFRRNPLISVCLKVLLLVSNKKILQFRYLLPLPFRRIYKALDATPVYNIRLESYVEIAARCKDCSQATISLS